MGGCERCVQRKGSRTHHSVPLGQDAFLSSLLMASHEVSFTKYTIKESIFFSSFFRFQVEIVPFSELEPGQRFEVSIRTDSDSKVALSAVDSAVYILNKKGKLSPQKVQPYRQPNTMFSPYNNQSTVIQCLILLSETQ